MTIRKILAWSVHFYTALGLLAAAGMAYFIVRGGEYSFRRVIGLMIIATVIDATDGTLARKVGVREVLPGFDGRRLDDIVDFQTYTSLPLLFLWRAEVFPEHLSAVLLAPLMASAYGFGQSDVKTEDHYFKGFPSYWNVVAIYLFWFRPPVEISIGVVLALSLLTFVPSLYLYPSYRGPFSNLTRVLCAVWALLLALITMGAFDDATMAIRVSAAFPVYYFVVSWWITVRRWKGAKTGVIAQPARQEE
ncbi:MAG: CDP-alcohol phosphatidyltransferase [Acidobacteriota bacterium]|nr:MAG: CDP-alcohol phosphatidyltransferase [Acidobacteriota bacterium]